MTRPNWASGFSRDPPLDTKNIQKIVEAEIDGRVLFLEGAGNLDFFMRAGLNLLLVQHLVSVSTSRIRSWPKALPVLPSQREIRPSNLIVLGKDSKIASKLLEDRAFRRGLPPK